MLTWVKATPKHLTAFGDGDFEWEGYTPDGFFYKLDYDDTLKLMTSNLNGAFVVNRGFKCVKYDRDRRFRLYSYKPDEWDLNRFGPEPDFNDNRWYFVNRLTKEVYVANHNGETVKTALEGTEALL